MGNYFIVGRIMSEATAKIDQKGRIMIPKKIRKAAKLKEGTCVTIKTQDNALIVEPAHSIAEKYCGIVKVEKWPQNLDEFQAEAIKKWWTIQST